MAIELFYIDRDRIRIHAETNDSNLEAAWHIRRAIRSRRASIVSIKVGKRKIKLTHSERYALYKAKMDKMQLDILQRAAMNPEDILLNSYTHLLILSDRFADDSFLDTQGVPQYKGDPWVKTEFDKLCEDQEKKLCF